MSIQQRRCAAEVSTHAGLPVRLIAVNPKADIQDAPTSKQRGVRGSGQKGAVMGTVWALWLFLAFVSGMIGHAIGHGKGRGGEGAFLGFFLGFVGWIAVGLMAPTAEVRAARTNEMVDALAAAGSRSPGSSSRPCPWCAEQIQPAAVLCRFCGRQVPPQSGAQGPDISQSQGPDISQLRATWRGDLPAPLIPLYNDRVMNKLAVLRGQPSTATLTAFATTVDDQARATGAVPLGAVKSSLLGAALLAGLGETESRAVIDTVCATRVHVPYVAWLPAP
jgi:uncharacterized protein YcfJ